MSEYLTVSGIAENTIVIEKSKFICYIKGIDGEEEAKEFITEIKKKNSLATHNCYAFIADDKGLKQKFSDDKEPQGTAGLPMLNALNNAKLKKVVAVVTRYFGGIKLGTGGLNRAYTSAVVECVKVAKTVLVKDCVKREVNADYALGTALIQALTDSEVKIINTNYDKGVCIVYAVSLDNDEIVKDRIVNLSNGKANITLIGNIKVEFDGVKK